MTDTLYEGVFDLCCLDSFDAFHDVLEAVAGSGAVMTEYTRGNIGNGYPSITLRGTPMQMMKWLAYYDPQRNWVAEIDEPMSDAQAWASYLEQGYVSLADDAAFDVA